MALKIIKDQWDNVNFGDIKISEHYTEQNYMKNTLLKKSYLELHIERTSCLPENVIPDTVNCGFGYVDKDSK